MFFSLDFKWTETISFLLLRKLLSFSKIFFFWLFLLYLHSKIIIIMNFLFYGIFEAARSQELLESYKSWYKIQIWKYNWIPGRTFSPDNFQLAYLEGKYGWKYFILIEFGGLSCVYLYAQAKHCSWLRISA